MRLIHPFFILGSNIETKSWANFVHTHTHLKKTPKNFYLTVGAEILQIYPRPSELPFGLKWVCFFLLTGCNHECSCLCTVVPRQLKREELITCWIIRWKRKEVALQLGTSSLCYDDWWNTCSLYPVKFNILSLYELYTCTFFPHGFPFLSLSLSLCLGNVILC